MAALGVIGASATPQAAQFQFSRGASLDIGQEEALRAYLAEVAPDARIDILFAGHTSTDGDTQANLDLARSRAGAALAIAQDMGIDPSRMRTAAVGGAQPLDRAPGVSDREYQRSLARVTVSTQIAR